MLFYTCSTRNDLQCASLFSRIHKMSGINNFHILYKFIWCTYSLKHAGVFDVLMQYNCANTNIAHCWFVIITLGLRFCITDTKRSLKFQVTDSSESLARCIHDRLSLEFSILRHTTWAFISHTKGPAKQRNYPGHRQVVQRGSIHVSNLVSWTLLATWITRHTR